MASRLQPYPRRLPSPWHRPLDVVSVVFGCFWLLFVCFVVHHPPRMLPFFLAFLETLPMPLLPSHLSMLASLARMESARSFLADQS